ncbi:MAG: hypothetical protein DRI54_06770 [Bacteroidetes bacterium]|nr:MAG: hypothetical protein DRI54_06770 [Bacteroidota bacterium]
MKTKSTQFIFSFVLIILLFLSVNTIAQKENIITGRVFPAGMQTPMRDVKVHIEGNDSLFVITDNSGSFSIDVESFPVNLVFSKDTYQTQVRKVKKPIDLSVYMLAGGKK